jgi:hypothetical protein
MQLTKQCFRLFWSLLLTLGVAHGQRYEITPLVGGMYGGTIKLEQQNVSPNVDAHLQDSLSFGIAGGFRFDADDIDEDICRACNLVEFRWLRQDTHLRLSQNPLLPPPVTTPVFNPRVTLDNFLADFTREWPLEDARKVRPFLTVSLGAARMSAPEASATRFVFGIGTGFKIYPKPRWGFVFQVEYLPVVMDVSVQRLVCAGGCIVALGGGVMNRFGFTVGPTFRF